MCGSMAGSTACSFARRGRISSPSSRTATRRTRETPGRAWRPTCRSTPLKSSSARPSTRAAATAGRASTGTGRPPSPRLSLPGRARRRCPCSRCTTRRRTLSAAARREAASGSTSAYWAARAAALTRSSRRSSPRSPGCTRSSGSASPTCSSRPSVCCTTRPTARCQPRATAALPPRLPCRVSTTELRGATTRRCPPTCKPPSTSTRRWTRSSSPPACGCCSAG
mmetsp:Transcript_25148/g.82136  ORF Transcript_25148/g.82136 Transcript_25148/m.82136 type:complete len:224 (-) Transcript_25148:213-884(-)